MKSDTRALLKVFGWSFAVAVLVIGIGVAAATGWLSRQQAIKLMVCFIIIGGVFIGSQYSRQLVQREPHKDKQPGPSAASDRDVSPPPGS
jgi:hypothetical protein